MENNIFNHSHTVTDEILNNEIRTNREISYLLLGFIFSGIVNIFLLKIDASIEALYINCVIFIPINVVLFVIVAIAHVFRNNKHWIKYMLLAGVILVTSMSFFAFTTYTIYLLFIPIFVSTRYFNKKIIKGVSILTGFLFLVAAALNVYLEPKAQFIKQLHDISSYNSWQYWTDALVYITTPCFISLVLVSMFAVKMTTSGKKLIDAKISFTEKIAAVNAEIDMASQIQKSVLPDSEFMTADGNFSLFAYESPAREMCGDFYDYYMINDDILAVTVADVSDKGMSAAMFMMSAKKALQCAVLSSHTLDDAIKLANRLICNDNKYGMFLTLWMAIIDTKSGVGKYVNAGHPYPIMKHKNGDIELIENEPDLFLGNFKDRNPKVHNFTMKPGDTLLIYTDGLTDAADNRGNTFSIDNVLREIRSSDNDPQKIVLNIAEKVKDFSKENQPFDDITMFAVQCKKTEFSDEIRLTENTGIEGTSVISNTLQDALKKTDCPDETRRNIGVIVDEVCTNISNYAYQDKEGKIDFQAILSDNCLEMTFSDEGIPFNPLLQENNEPAPLQIGGLGIYFIKQLSDDISYSYANNKNNLKISVIWKI